MTRRAVLEAGLAAGALGLSGASLLTCRRARRAGIGVREISPAPTGVHSASRSKAGGSSASGLGEGSAPAPALEGVLDSVYSPTRIKYPMVRRAFLEHGLGADPEDRGDGDFVRVTWDQALDLVVKELSGSIRPTAPPPSSPDHTAGRARASCTTARNLLRRMMSLKGGFVNSSGDYSTGASQVIMPYVVGSLEVYDQTTAWPVVVQNTELMVFWGADPINNNRIGWSSPITAPMSGWKPCRKRAPRSSASIPSGPRPAAI